MSENNKKYILITAALIVIGAALYFFYWMRTPQYTFTQIHEAVQQHDLTKFEKHVDLNSLYAHAYDDVVYYAFGDPKEANPFLLGIVQSLKSVVVPIMTEQTKHYVETGSIEDNKEETSDIDDTAPAPTPAPSPKTEGQQLAEQLKERTGFGTMRYEGVESSEQVGKTADVAVKLYDKQLEHNFILHVKMYELDDGSWRLTEITNLKELLKEREQATAAKLKQLNSKVQAELDAAVTAVPGTIAIDSSGGWFPSYTMQNTFTLNNISAKTITGLQGSVEVFDNDGMLLQRCRFNDYLTLAPQGSSSLKKLFSLNQFKPETVRLLRSDLKTVKWQVTISSVSFDDGSQLQLLTQLPKAKYKHIKKQTRISVSVFILLISVDS